MGPMLGTTDVVIEMGEGADGVHITACDEDEGSWMEGEYGQATWDTKQTSINLGTGNIATIEEAIGEAAT